MRSTERERLILEGVRPIGPAIRWATAYALRGPSWLPRPVRFFPLRVVSLLVWLSAVASLSREG